MMRPLNEVSFSDVINWGLAIVHTGILGWFYTLWRRMDRIHRRQAVREYQNKIVWQYVAKQIGIDPTLNGHAPEED